MPLTGGLCPAPYRLGGDATTGVTAAQHARACSDVVSAQRTMPFARMAFEANGYGPAIVTYYSGRNGSGVAYAPTVIWVDPADPFVQIDFPATYEDELGNTIPLSLSYAKACTNDGNSGPYICVTNVSPPTRVYVTAIANSVAYQTSHISILFYSDSEAARTLADYGGSLDKCDCTSESTPYSWQIYRQLQSARGSAYSQELTGLVHVENLCIARHYQWQLRLAEKLACESNPSTADAKLEQWCTVLAVPRRYNETDAEKRARCAAAFVAAQGPTIATVDNAISTLLGPSYVRTWRSFGATLSAPPTHTYWPGYNEGPVSIDLGGGTWSSERANLVVEVQQPGSVDSTTWLRSLNVELHQLLDKLLPATCTFNWATNVEDGFLLDYDALDYAGLGA